MEFDNVYLIKKQLDKKQFLRQVMIQMTNSPTAPIGITKAKFGEVKESIREVMAYRAEVKTDYSASVGFDRRETYRDKNGNQQTRTVTDWKPHSGHEESTWSGCLTNGESDLLREALKSDKKSAPDQETYHRCALRLYNNDYTAARENRLGGVIDSLTDDDIAGDDSDDAVSCAPAATKKTTVNPDALGIARTYCQVRAEKSIRFPGNQHKDENFNSSVKFVSLDCYKLPVYEVEYEYEGKKYRVSGFALKKSCLNIQMPSGDNVSHAAEAETKKSKRVSIILWGAFIAAAVLSLILCFTKVFFLHMPYAVAVLLLFAIPAVVFAVATTFNVLYQRNYNKKIKAHAAEKITKQHADLEAWLKKENYPALTAGERALFDPNKRAAESDKTVGNHSKKPIILGAIGLAVVLIVCLIAGRVINILAQHSPDNFDLAITNKTAAQVDEFRNEYVGLTYRVKANDRSGAQSISVETTVKQNGREIGTITVHIGSMDLKAGETKTYQAKIYQKDNAQLFNSLKSASFSNLSFSLKIKSITFDDGNVYNAR